MTCEQLMLATEIILRLATEKLPQVILYAEPTLVQMTIDNFHLEWEVVRQLDGFTTVRRK